MKNILLTLSLLVFSFTSFGQREFEYNAGDTTYSMKRYVFMLLNSGETKSKDSIESAHFQEMHLAHLNRLSKEGKLVVAGPFDGGGNHRGLLIFDVETVEEALKLEGEDPTVKTGRLKMEAFYWYGAKGTVIK